MDNDNRHAIAVVNDDPEFLRLVNNALEAVGPYEVFTFRDQETSLSELRAVRPELIVIDIVGAEAPSGRELALLAGADADLGPVPVIVTSPDVPGLGRRVDELRAVANVRVLSKPFTLDQLRDMVRDAIGAAPEPETGSSAGS